MAEYELLFKFCAVGDSGVGKSTLVFGPDLLQVNIGLDFRSKIITLVESDTKTTVKIQLWDTAGQERFRQITVRYYRNAAAILVAYDVTNGESFRSLSRWLDEIDINAPEYTQKVIVGCKIDLEAQRVVPREAAIEFAAERGLPYFECSARLQEGVNELINETAQTVLRLGNAGMIPLVRPAPPPRVVKRGESESNRKRSPDSNLICTIS